MTAQISDSIKYRGEWYDIAGVNGSGLFDPADYGMEPIGRCSSCWHGFLCDYEVEDRKLMLVRLRIWVDEPAPILFGVAPQQDQGMRRFDAVYEGMAKQLPYSGGLLIAADFIEELYVHMGFPPAWKYGEVHELRFRDGELVQEIDRSEEIAEFRSELSDCPLEPGHVDWASVERWIEQCFSRQYRW